MKTDGHVLIHFLKEEYMSRLERINWTTKQLKINNPRSHSEVYSNTFRAIWRLLPDEAEFLTSKIYYGSIEEDASFSARREMLRQRNHYLTEFTNQSNLIKA